MKKVKSMTSEEISSLCMELALLTHSGLEISDGLHLLAEDAAGEQREMLNVLAETVDGGSPLSDAMRNSGVFPNYVCSLTAVGERSGRPEESLRALSAYYEGQARLEMRVRDAVLYPASLLLLMLVVIAVLLVKVLPVFNDVFTSLGGRMTGLAGGLLALGRGMDRILPVLWGRFWRSASCF
jgi:type IV pilus assembly protein PilC